ncbi:MAG: hypothetical protein ACRCZF_04170 [Gemmataceae bacterium]
MSSEVTPEVRTQRVKEFLQILPLTAEIAGLPHMDPNRPFTADQLDLRATHLRTAYKLARKMLKELGESGE